MAVDSRTAATHRWMGQPLSVYADSELKLILLALEQVAGKPITVDRLFRWELLEKICRLDLELERWRRQRSTRRPAVEAREPGARAITVEAA